MKKIHKTLVASAVMAILSSSMAFASDTNNSLVSGMHHFKRDQVISASKMNENFDHLTDTLGLSDYTSKSTVQNVYLQGGDLSTPINNASKKSSVSTVIHLARNTYTITAPATMNSHVTLMGNNDFRPTIIINNSGSLTLTDASAISNIDFKGQITLNTQKSRPARLTNIKFITNQNFTSGSSNNEASTDYAIIKDSEFNGDTSITLPTSAHVLNSFQLTSDGTFTLLKNQ